VDDDLPTGGELLRRYRREVASLRVVPLPYRAARALGSLVAWYARTTEGHVPPVLTPYKVDSLWKPQRYSNAAAKAVLGWAPRVSMQVALDRTFDALAAGARGAVPLRAEGPSSLPSRSREASA
jgi:hypothetical protein